MWTLEKDTEKILSSPFQKGQKQEVNKISSVSAMQMQFPLLEDNIYSKLRAFKERTPTQFPSSFSRFLNVYLWKTLQAAKANPQMIMLLVAI